MIKIYVLTQIDKRYSQIYLIIYNYRNRGYGHDGATDRIYAAISYKILYLATYSFFLVISWLALQIKINLFST